MAAHVLTGDVSRPRVTVTQHEAEEAKMTMTTLPQVERIHEQGCEFDSACIEEGTRLRGDLFVCVEHSKVASRDVSDTETRCMACGYIKPKGLPCGEPCL